VLSGREFSHAAYRISGGDYSKVDEIKSNFRKNRFAIATSEGYDEYYYLRSEGLDTDEDAEIEVKSSTTKGLVSAFSKYTGNRVSSRVVLNRFIGMIT
jgi:hypothetical protein